MTEPLTPEEIDGLLSDADEKRRLVADMAECAQTVRAVDEAFRELNATFVELSKALAILADLKP